MKKKALFSAVASVALAGVMAVGFTACKPSAKSVKGEEVDKATWDAAMDFSKWDNYKAYHSTTAENKGEGYTVKGSAEYTIVVEGANQYVKAVIEAKVDGTLPDELKDGVKSKKEMLEYYINGNAATPEIIAKVDGKWTKISEETELVKYSVSAMLFSYIIGGADFEAYEYNKEQNGYTLKGAPAGSFVVFKIQKGKLAAIYGETKDPDDGTLEIENFVFTHGKQKVSIPNVYPMNNSVDTFFRAR